MNIIRRRVGACAALISLLAVGEGLVFATGSSHEPGAIFNAGAGARPLAMAGAYTALVRDANSLYHNPAGLGLVDGRQLLFMRAQLFEDASYNYMAMVNNTRRFPGAWGVEFLRMGSGDAPGRTSLNQESGSFDYSETGFGLGLGARGVLLPAMSVGLRLKMLKRNLAGSSDSLMGGDVGVQYGPLWDERLSLGAVVQNAFQRRSGDTADSLTPTGRLGASLKLFGPMLLSADVSSSREFRIGTEYAFGMLAIRAGIQREGVSFGGGLLFRGAFALDMAMLSNSTLGTSQRFSLGYKFSSPKARKLGNFAHEHLNNAVLEFERRNYVVALRDFETAFGIDPRLGDQGWGSKSKRLARLVSEMGLAAQPDTQEVFLRKSVQSLVGHQAIVAYIERDESRAMVFAHVAHGQDTRESAFQTLLYSLARLTRQEVRREDILSPGFFVQRRMQEVVDAIYRRNYDAAIRACKDALQLDPNNALAWTRLGSAYFASGDKTNAANAYRNALKLNPEDSKLRQFVTQQGLE